VAKSIASCWGGYRNRLEWFVRNRLRVAGGDIEIEKDRALYNEARWVARLGTTRIPARELIPPSAHAASTMHLASALTCLSMPFTNHHLNLGLAH
jgi:hypothetical protein